MKFLTLIAMFFVMSCSTVQPVVCTVEQSAASAIAAGIGTALSCTNLPQIQSDLLGALGKVNLCSMASSAKMMKHHLKGPVGNVVCPIAVEAAIGLGASKVPASWGCSANTSMSGLSAVLITACEQVVPI